LVRVLRNRTAHSWSPRMTLKPVTEAILRVCKATPSQYDDEFLAFLDASDSDVESPRCSAEHAAVRRQAPYLHALEISGIATCGSAPVPAAADALSHGWKISVALLSGVSVQLILPDDIALHELKKRLKVMFGRDSGGDGSSMVLAYGGVTLDDENARLGSYNVADGAQLQLLYIQSVKVKVAMVCLPMGRGAEADGRERSVHVYPREARVSVQTCAQRPEYRRDFAYDAVFDESATSQQELFEALAVPLLDGFLDGYNTTMIALGAPAWFSGYNGRGASGKSYTMFGLRSGDGRAGFVHEPEQEHDGLIPRSFTYLYDRISHMHDVAWIMSCSFVAIQDGSSWDLLSRLQCSPDMCTVEAANTLDQIRQCFKRGWDELSRNSYRFFHNYIFKVPTTAIFTIHLQRCDSSGENREAKLLMIKSSVEDVIPPSTSQRQCIPLGKHGVGDMGRGALARRALRNVVHALADGGTAPVPYADSMLTRLLKESLGGNAKTLVIGHVSPADYHTDDSMSILRLCSRAKDIELHPSVNRICSTDPSV